MVRKNRGPQSGNYGIIPTMRQMLQNLHAKLGDFWWYSLMLFCACRAAGVATNILFTGTPPIIT